MHLTYNELLRYRAMRGFAVERKILLQALKQEETMRDHFVIQTSSGRSVVTGMEYKPDPILEQKKKDCADRIRSLAERLEEISC